LWGKGHRASTVMLDDPPAVLEIGVRTGGLMVLIRGKWGKEHLKQEEFPILRLRGEIERER